MCLPISFVPGSLAAGCRTLMRSAHNKEKSRQTSPDMRKLAIMQVMLTDEFCEIVDIFYRKMSGTQ